MLQWPDARADAMCDASIPNRESISMLAQRCMIA
jgi:hypothetical protein